jgi:hypothetical protein
MPFDIGKELRDLAPSSRRGLDMVATWERSRQPLWRRRLLTVLASAGLITFVVIALMNVTPFADSNQNEPWFHPSSPCQTLLHLSKLQQNLQVLRRRLVWRTRMDRTASHHPEDGCGACFLKSGFRRGGRECRPRGLRFRFSLQSIQGTFMSMSLRRDLPIQSFRPSRGKGSDT